MNKAQPTALTKRQKAAILLVAIGPEAVAKIFKHLREDDIEGLTLDIEGGPHFPINVHRFRRRSHLPHLGRTPGRRRPIRFR